MFTDIDGASSSAPQFEYQDTSEIRYIEGEEESNGQYITTQEEDIKYPVTDEKKPFVCQHCGVSFAREKALASHSRIHGGDSPFECHKCGEMFWDLGLMQVKYLKKKFKINIRMFFNYPVSKDILCKLPVKQFKNSWQLNDIHLNICH